MKTQALNPTGLIEQLLDAFSEGPQEVLALFHEQAVIEYPYASTLGTPGKLTKSEYAVYLKSALASMPAIAFSNVQIYPLQAPDQVWAEFHGETTVPATQARYEQDYVVRVTFQEGMIIHYREYWNPMKVEAFGGDQAAKDIFTHL